MSDQRKKYEPAGADLATRIREHELLGTADLVERIQDALEIAQYWGRFEHPDRKAWVIDQMIRALTQGGYDDFVVRATTNSKGIKTYEWPEGRGIG